jgi:hypothetical protein
MLWLKRSPYALHFAVERLFAGMRERRMAHVVNQREGFGEIFVESQNAGDGAGNLRDLDGVRQAIAESDRTRPGAKTWVLFSRRRKARE